MLVNYGSNSVAYMRLAISNLDGLKSAQEEKESKEMDILKNFPINIVLEKVLNNSFLLIKYYEISIVLKTILQPLVLFITY